MSDRMLRAGLRFGHAGNKDGVFFEEIDKTGGWPLGYQFVGFEHSTERAAGFTKYNGNDGWWTVVASADDYYLWKLSPQALQRVADAIADRMKWQIMAPSVKGLEVRDSRGYVAVLKGQP